MSDTEWRIEEGSAGVRLDKFLADTTRLGSRGRAMSALVRGKIYLNDVEAGPDDAGHRLVAGDVVRAWLDRPGSSRRTPRTGVVGGVDIVHEDEELIVVNKPAGILTVPLERRPEALSVLGQIENRFRSHGRKRVFPVHRIDQNTSGLVVFAKHVSSQRVLKEQFKRREANRIYWAVVYGRPDPCEGIWRDVLVWDEKALIQKQTHPRDPRGQEALSRYRVLEAFEEASLIEVTLHTGRRNQIRIQARLRGHTLVGEDRYVYGPGSLRPIEFGRHALHARQLSIRHPVDGRTLELEAPLPTDFLELLTRLRRRA
jgi:23S rRNA pseudouridine1911/1915/1917 synthase